MVNWLIWFIAFAQLQSYGNQPAQKPDKPDKLFISFSPIKLNPPEPLGHPLLNVQEAQVAGGLIGPLREESSGPRWCFKSYGRKNWGVGKTGALIAMERKVMV